MSVAVKSDTPPHLASATATSPRMINHLAYVTHDYAATVDFYTKVLGMEVVNTIIGDRIPSTGDPFPYFHFFFRLQDGSTLAFFDAPDLPRAPEANHVGHGIFNHLAFHATSDEEVLQWKERLDSHGVESLGPIDHDGEFLSVYFFDPNGIRLEFTHPRHDTWNNNPKQASSDLARWTKVNQDAISQGRPVGEAVVESLRKDHDAAN